MIGSVPGQVFGQTHVAFDSVPEAATDIDIIIFTSKLPRTRTGRLRLSPPCVTVDSDAYSRRSPRRTKRAYARARCTMHTASRDTLKTHSASLEPAALHTTLAALISFESVFRSACSSSSRARLAARAH
eukprot:6974167-Prymnesium_polylepis.2